MSERRRRRPGPGDIGGRSEARERALALLYEAEAKDVDPRVVLEGLPVAPEPYAVVLVEGVAEHRGRIDDLLGTFAEGWTVARMASIDRCVLRLGTFELLERPGVPTGVVLSEAVELASRYSTDASGPFVNGLLARVAREVRGGEPAPEPGSGSEPGPDSGPEPGPESDLRSEDPDR